MSQLSYKHYRYNIIVLYASLLENKPTLFLLSIESSSRGQEGRGDQQISPELVELEQQHS